MTGTRATHLLDDLTHLRSRAAGHRFIDIEMRLEQLSAEIGEAGAAPDIDRALAAAEDGVRQLRDDIRRYLLFRADAPASASYSGNGRRVSLWKELRLSACLVLLGLTLLAVALLLSGHLKTVTVVAGLVIGGAGLFLPLAFAAISLAFAAMRGFQVLPHAASEVANVMYRCLLLAAYSRLAILLSRIIGPRYRSWRYAVLRDVATAMLVTVLLFLGTVSVLIATYANKEAFGTTLDYAMLGFGGAGTSIVAGLASYLSNWLRDRTTTSG